MTRGDGVSGGIVDLPRLEAVSRKSSYHSIPSRCICINSLPLKFMSYWFLQVEAVECGISIAKEGVIRNGRAGSF